MAQDEKIFADGFSFKRNEKAPDFVVGRLSIKAEDGVAFIRQHEKGGWVNLNIKTARSGNHYVELDTYEPTQGGSNTKKEAHNPMDGVYIPNWDNKPATPKQKAPQPEVAEDEDGELPF
jgi:hypothetical protein